MNLVIHHVLQTLVVGGAKKHLCVQLAASEPIIEHLVATEVIIIALQEVGDLLHINGIIKGCGISNLTLVGRDLHRKGSVTWQGEQTTPTLP